MSTSASSAAPPRQATITAAELAASLDPSPARLRAQPTSFDFFQAVRLLTRIARRTGGDATPPSRAIGHDYAPRSEIVRFRALPSHSFPPAEIIAVTGGGGQDANGLGRVEMTVSFFGLTGPAGALPHHYTQTVIDRVRQKDYTLRDFFDLFNHRLISLFYRAWEKHQAIALLERAHSEACEDAPTRSLYCLTGFGAAALRERTEFSDQIFLVYGGLFAHYPKNAASLERLLAELFELEVGVEQFQGQWLHLEPSEQSAMPSRRQSAGLNCALGVTTIAGERVWSIESKFRIRLGPMGYDQFRQLMPGCRKLVQLGQVARTYVGPEFDFDIQPVLRGDETPPCRLAADGEPPRLGWNTWVASVPRSRDADDAIFVAEGLPSR